MGDRYVIESGSQSNHCCFECTVVDTHKSNFGRFEAICECFSLEDAELIARALNAY